MSKDIRNVELVPRDQKATGAIRCCTSDCNPWTAHSSLRHASLFQIRLAIHSAGSCHIGSPTTEPTLVSPTPGLMGRQLRNGGVVEFGQSTIVAGWTVAREPEHNRALCETLTLTAAVRLATGFRADVNERGLTVGPPCCHGLASPEAVLLKGWERMLGTLLIAAAGLAEAVWLWEMLIMTGLLLVIGLFATIAMGLRSTVSLMVSMMLLVIFMTICRPWSLSCHLTRKRMKTTMWSGRPRGFESWECSGF